MAVFTLPLLAQVEKKRPEFTDYPVQQIYRGVPAAPVLNKDHQSFRTMIRRGAKTSIRFAGHYTVPMWGCGTGCSTFTIADSISGKVYELMSVADLPFEWLQQQKRDMPERIEFRPDSRLLKINGCPNETNCGFYDYLIVDGKGLTLLRKELLPKAFQP